MTIPIFLIMSLAVYRMTHFIVFDKIFEPIRSKFVTRDFKYMTYTLQGGIIRRYIGKIMVCFWCAGIWVSAFVTLAFLAYPPSLWFYAIWAFAGVQALLQSGWVKLVGYPELREDPLILSGGKDPLRAARGIMNAIIISMILVAFIIGWFYIINKMLG